MKLIEDNIFNSSIYFDEKKEWIKKLNEISDSYILESRAANKISNKKDFITVHHSKSLIEDVNFKEFINYINSNAFYILDNQGFNLEDYFLYTTELWVQEFPTLGGGNHSPHIHWNGHISGFYFLKCSKKTSYPVFHDPRAGRMMSLLPEKNKFDITSASSSIHYKPEPGVFIFFNSYLEHEFVVDEGIEPFRFIHFNIKAFPKKIINDTKNNSSNSLL